MLKLNGYGGRQAKVNEKSQCFKGWETLVSFSIYTLGDVISVKFFYARYFRRRFLKSSERIREDPSSQSPSEKLRKAPEGLRTQRAQRARGNPLRGLDFFGGNSEDSDCSESSGLPPLRPSDNSI